MWQIICLCLPALTLSERRRFFKLFNQTVLAAGREPSEIDVGLFFLHSLRPSEALTVLEERRELVVRSQELMAHHATEPAADILQIAIDDHIQTLLAAEHSWLDRTIARLQDPDILDDLLKKEIVL